jgi:hypothetical protein
MIHFFVTISFIGFVALIIWAEASQDDHMDRNGEG